MILNRLVELYERLAASPDPERRLSEPGWQWREISFVIDLSPEGEVVRVTDLRQPNGKGRPRGRMCLVPQEASRTGSIPDPATEKDCWRASLFWDNTKYALGVPKKDTEKDAREAKACHNLFRLRHETFFRPYADADCNARKLRHADEACAAMLGFLAPCERIATNKHDEITGNVAFRLDGDTDLMCRRPAIQDAISKGALGSDDDATGQCGVTGKQDRIARLHMPSIKGVLGGQTSGCFIASYNAEAFESYGLKNGWNAPTGVYATHAYATALNSLLAYGSPHRAQAGAITIAFWAGQQTENETVVCDLMTSIAVDDPARSVVTLERLYAAPTTGSLPPLDDTTPFFVLAMSAESRSRITVRLFHEGTVAQAAHAIKAWFDDLRIAPESRRQPTIQQLMAGMSAQGDVENAPPLLGAELLHAAYTGCRLPELVLAEALIRSAAEGGPNHERAALIKAYQIRNTRKEVSVSLDPDEPDPAYRLGRLFAVLEYVQQRAVGAKAGIAGRYWGAASTTPGFVFPGLLRLAVHHLDKLDETSPGPALARRKEIEEITSGLPPRLPSRLDLAGQGSFAIGYWHQRQARWTTANATKDTDNEQEQAA